MRSRGSNHDNGANHDPHFFCPPSIVFQKPYMLFFTKYYVSWTPRDKNRSKPISRSRVYVGIWVRLRPVSSMLTNTCTSKFYVGAHIYANTEETGSITPHGLGRPSWFRETLIVRAGEKVPSPLFHERSYFPWWTPASEQSSTRRGKKSPLSSECCHEGSNFPWWTPASEQRSTRWREFRVNWSQGRNQLSRHEYLL